MQIKVRKGFTLIELLVVITIIGILATGAVQVFTSQIQKARDTTRISDISALRGGLEQYYQDRWEYPSKGASFTGVQLFVAKLPTDPKTGQASSNSVFDYAYNISADANGINAQEFEVSAHFENQSNRDNKAATDGGDDNERIEFWIDVNDDTWATKPTVIAGSAVTGNSLECVAPAGWAATAANCWTAANPMIIK